MTLPPGDQDDAADDGLPDPHHITRPVEIVLGTFLLAAGVALLIWLPGGRTRLFVPGWVLGCFCLAGAVWRYAIAWRAGRD